jgi:DMSO/TMAO reductase YedYZ molybdopterin-dependent catalytic subunit
MAQAMTTTTPSRLIHRRDPETSEYPFAALESFITPNDLFYVRNHLLVPSIDPERWRLTVDGGVAEPRSLSLADLQAMPQVTLTCTLECAGNGGPWGFLSVGGVSTAAWTGVRLADVLARACPLAETVEAVFVGLDHGEDPTAPGITEYARSLPLEKARHPDTLLAYAMNGEPLPPNHGFPLRLVAPAWYGMDSVKWLGAIRLVAEPYQGFYMTERYRRFRGERGTQYGPMVREMRIKSMIARPQAGERVPLGPVLVRGAAWAGAAGVARVDVSTDGGATWQDAALDREEAAYCWRLWSYRWQPEQPGAYALVVRATDTNGAVQPVTEAPQLVPYGYNWSHPLTVHVEDVPDA